MIDVQIRVHDIEQDGLPEATEIRDNVLQFYWECEWIRGVPAKELDSSNNPKWERISIGLKTETYSGVRYYTYLPARSFDSPLG